MCIRDRFIIHHFFLFAILYIIKTIIYNVFNLGVFSQINLQSTSIGCNFPFDFNGGHSNRFCSNEGFTTLPDNTLWTVKFRASSNTGPRDYLQNPNDPFDVGYLTYVSENNNNDVAQTAYVSPILDATQISTLEVKFNYVLNGLDVGALCKHYFGFFVHNV